MGWRRQQSGPRWPFDTVNGPCASSADHQRWHTHTQMAAHKERKGRYLNSESMPVKGGAGAEIVIGCLPLQHVILMVTSRIVERTKNDDLCIRESRARVRQGSSAGCRSAEAPRSRWAEPGWEGAGLWGGDMPAC